MITNSRTTQARFYARRQLIPMFYQNLLSGQSKLYSFAQCTVENERKAPRALLSGRLYTLIVIVLNYFGKSGDGHAFSHNIRVRARVSGT
jgi:hypothetical protein